MNNILEKLKKYNQEHLLKYYDELTDNEKESLLNQIDKIDFDELNNLYKMAIKNEKTSSDNNLEPLIAETSIKEEWLEAGVKILKELKYAVVTIAGGQGTRLGYAGPKGTYFLEYGINKSIFEIQCDRLKDLYNKYNIYVDWYIMTSNENHHATINFFEKNNYFNYPKEKVSFFQQSLLPMIHTDGKIIMDSKSSIKLGPNGSGGVFKALSDEGILKKMEKDNIEYIFIGGIDNILISSNDLSLVGYAYTEKLMAVSQSVAKDYPEEKVGVFCLKNGRPGIVEYIDISEELSCQKDSNGDLKFIDANIQAYLFNIKILKETQNKPLPYHVALKKSDYIDEFGNNISPEKENAYKFEMFLFDIFPYVDKLGLIRGLRQNVFAPIKNKDGVDSPSTASKLYNDYHQNN